MKKIAFTICAKNYIGLAQTLEKSIYAHDEDIQFFIFVADEIKPEDNLELLATNILIAKDVVDIPKDQWYQMAFKYDLTEFCTSIKPSCFKFIFKTLNPDACIYFDPDILVYNSLNIIYDQLKEYSIMVTPHITTIEENYSGNLNERNLLYSGMFNLGFLGLKNDYNTTKLLNWWEVRLEDRCYQNMMENYFTDQKWMDFIPSFFPTQLLISQNLGLNMAPWNFYEREIFQRDNNLFVKNRLDSFSTLIYPLTFVHFSGFDYKALLNNKVVQGNIKSLEIQSDLETIFSIYKEKLLHSNISKYINYTYSYSCFSNGVQISIVYRKLYRRLLEDKKINFNPFEAEKPFYYSLKNNGVINEQMIRSDKSSISNIENAEGKTLKINRLLKFAFKFIGSQRFFQLVRLMRLYSKIENHIYLIDKEYLKKFKIWN